MFNCSVNTVHYAKRRITRIYMHHDIRFL